MPLDKPTRRQFLRTVGLAGATALLPGCERWAPPAGVKRKRPNVVIIVSDDHRWDLMSHAGHPIVHTPNLDRMAARGMTLRNAFATSGVCSPSRATILTGKHAHRAGAPNIIMNNHSFLWGATPFPARLHAAGYHTAHIGKWHLGHDSLPKPGYDHWVGYDFPGKFHDPTLTINGTPRDFTGFSDDVLAELAADYIRGRAAEPSDQPFCLFLGLKSPHHPYAFPERYKDAFNDVNIPRPDNYDEDYAASGRPDFWNDCLIRMEDFPGAVPRFGSFEQVVRSYYRSAQSIDDSVGAVQRALESTGLDRNTLVIYTSDQGYTLGEHGLVEKHFAYEPASRIPMLVQYPGVVEPGSTCDELVLTNDLAPTILEMCGLEPPPDADGRSWKRILHGAREPLREDFLFHQWSPGTGIPGQLAVRGARYKYIRYPYIEGDHEELYDLREDPGENLNLAGRPGFEAITTRMRERLERLVEQHDLHFAEVRMLDRACFAAPAGPAQAEPLKQTLLRDRCGRINEAWTALSAIRDKGFDLGSTMDLVPGQPLLIGIPVQRLTDYDPHLEIRLSPHVAHSGYVNGAYVDYIPREINWTMRMNPPLADPCTFVLLETTVPEGGWLRLDMHVPPGAVHYPAP